MLEQRSALAEAKGYKSGVLAMGEVRGFSLVQLADLTGDVETRLQSVFRQVPGAVGVAIAAEDRTLMRISPSQFWIIAPEADELSASFVGACAVTPLSHSRTRIFIEGVPVRDVLAKGISLDFHLTAFTPGMFAMTGLHHTPVTVHCVSENRFELYAMRTFAMSVWEWLCDAALEFQAA